MNKACSQIILFVFYNCYVLHEIFISNKYCVLRFCLLFLTDDSFSDHHENEQSNFQAEIFSMQKSLKKVKPPLPGRPKSPETPAVMPQNTANLTIQQRIALMKGKSAGGIEISSSPSPPPPSAKPSLGGSHPMPIKPQTPPKKTAPPTPMKPNPSGPRKTPVGYDTVPIRNQQEAVPSLAPTSVVTTNA